MLKMTENRTAKEIHTIRSHKFSTWKDAPTSIIIDTTKHDPLAMKKYLEKLADDEVKMLDYILQEVEAFLEEKNVKI